MDAKSLQEAIQLGLDQLDRGESITFESMDEMEQLLNKIADGMSADDAIAQHRAAQNPL